MNSNIKSNIPIKVPLTIALFTLIYLGSLNNTSSVFKIFGYSSLLIALILGSAIYILYIFQKNHIYKDQLILVLATTPFLLIQFYGFLIYPPGLSTLLQFVLLIAFMIVVSTIKWDNRTINIIGNITSIFILIQFALWAIQGFPSFFTSIYGLSNLVGAYMFYGILLLFLARTFSKRKYTYNILILMAFSLLIGTNTRSVLLSLVCFVVIMFIWGIITKNKFRYYNFFFFVITSLLSIIYFYPKLPELKIFPILENWMLTNTGKSIMSGREDIWTTLLFQINNHPWLGHGTGIQNTLISSLDQGSHNLYLQIAVQNGYLGLFTFLLFLLIIWTAFWKGRKQPLMKIIAPAFIATLIYQSFEITLTQNALSIGIIQWSIIGIGISCCIYNKAEDTKQNSSIKNF